MKYFRSQEDGNRPIANAASATGLPAHPDDVLADADLTIGEKRALLAAWASDANAVPSEPMLRQLLDGSIVELDELVRALKKLDGSAEASRSSGRPATYWQRPLTRRSAWP